MTSHLTHAQRHRITRRDCAGELAGELAREFGISSSGVSRLARYRGKPSSLMRKRAAWVEKIEGMRASGALTHFIFRKAH